MDCRNHPGRAAPWICPTCESLYCSDCILRREVNPMTREVVKLCPQCIVLIEPSGVSPDITPYWQQMSRFFLYPLKLRGLLVIIGLTIGLLFSSAFVFIPIVMMASFFLISAMSVKYAFDILQSTASGDMEPPPFQFNDLFQDLLPLIKQAIVYGVMFGAVAFATIRVGANTGMVAQIAVLAILPSQIILIGATNSLLQALNPVKVFQVISRIGLPYLGMAAIVLFLGTAPGIISGWVAGFLSPRLLIAFSSMFGFYYLFVSYHLMGYMMLQFSQEVGYEVDLEVLEAATRGKEKKRRLDHQGPENKINTAKSSGVEGPDPFQELKIRLKGLIQDGRLDEALSDIETAVKPDKIDDLDLARQYFELLKILGNTERQHQFMPRYLDLLAGAGDKKAGMVVYQDMITTNGGISPNADAMHKLVLWLLETRKYEESLSMAQNAIKADPEHPQVPETYFRVAQIYYDGLLEKEKSVKVLNGLVKRYPDHPVTVKAQNYLGQIV